jgi:uncharacterized protein YbjT (DUF2867 family)
VRPGLYRPSSMSAMRIAVAGGTGVVGRHVVDAVVAAGHEPVVLARSTGVDLLTGAGVREALEGVSAVVDVSNTLTARRRTAIARFDRMTSNLLDAAKRAAVGHHVLLSIVGIDRVPVGYYAGKLRQEELVKASGLPWTILRATQFHEFPEQLLDRFAGPVLPLPRVRSQPVAAREVGAALVELALGAPTGRTDELGGPEAHEMRTLVRRLLAARGAHRWVLPIALPGVVGRGFAGGGLLPGPGARLGTQTWDEWLAEQR